MDEGQEPVRQGRDWPPLLHAGQAGGAHPRAPCRGHDSLCADLDAIPSRSVHYTYFNDREAAFIEAAVDTLIPSDHAGPGARDLAVAVFIDRRLSRSRDRSDRSDCHRRPAPGCQGYHRRLSLTQRALISAGIADVDAFCCNTRNTVFAAMPPPDRATVLSQVEHGEADLASVPNATFFSLLLQLTVEGYLAAPI
jgi:gluconate 2-dehydrogenase gamma chain